MDPDTGIIILGIAQAVCLVAMIGAAIALALSARRFKAAADSVRGGGERLAKIGMDARDAAVARVQRVTETSQALVRGLEQRWQTIRHLALEVARPEDPARHALTGRVDRGGRLADRVLRLRAAALKASGHPAPVRSKKS
jgi:hypothetical protein